MLKAPYVLALAVVVATLVPVLLAFTPIGPKISGNQKFGIYDNANSRIEDVSGDAEGISEVRDYHDILGASVVKFNEVFFFTIDLAGNPNNNENYETIYRWHIVTTSPITNRDQQYTIMFPNFAPSSNSTTEGWYFVVYDENVNAFIVGPTRIPDMSENKIEFPVEDFYIGSPTKFVYWVDVSVRFNATFGEPDYLVDYAP